MITMTSSKGFWSPTPRLVESTLFWFQQLYNSVNYTFVVASMLASACTSDSGTLSPIQAIIISFSLIAYVFYFIQVRKHIENQSKESRFEFIINVESCCQFCGEIILHAYEPGQSHSGLLLSDSTEGVTATMPSSSTTAKRSGLWCHRCERHGVNCSICEQSLKESAFFCTQCGHGFHSEEIAAWFSKHVECPGGCGCRCGEMYQQEEELYQNELWASRHLMPSQAQFSLAET